NLDDKKTRDELFKGYMRFVIMIAKEYIDGKNELVDLIASGNQGLTKAVESFDCTKNISFAILAEWLIHQEIIKKILSDDR
ncbi:MAG: RNA polymerase subunit sigma, partial [Prevotella sp.]|nr:RNA polymerase subunit sigma [Prevotella sp.]